ncbi:MAG: hypothetical protein IT381_24630 [Deltaproteobacteria bacterium]|nr:hypothetical protein [Deltaproteobacteria bacterium]
MADVFAPFIRSVVDAIAAAKDARLAPKEQQRFERELTALVDADRCDDAVFLQLILAAHRLGVAGLEAAAAQICSLAHVGLAATDARRAREPETRSLRAASQELQNVAPRQAGRVDPPAARGVGLRAGPRKQRVEKRA